MSFFMKVRSGISESLDASWCKHGWTLLNVAGDGWQTYQCEKCKAEAKYRPGRFTQPVDTSSQG